MDSGQSISRFGRCPMPCSGQSLKHFAISTSAEPQSGMRGGVDWRLDPFAGNRLTTVEPVPRRTFKSVFLRRYRSLDVTVYRYAKYDISSIVGIDLKAGLAKK